MARYHTSSSSFTPSPVQDLVLEAAEEGVSWESIGTLLDHLARPNAAGERLPEFAPSAVWDTQGNNLLGALIKTHRSGYGNAHVPQPILDRLLKIDPGALLFRNKEGKPPSSLYLSQLADPNRAALATFPWWCKHTPFPLLAEWAPSGQRGEIKAVDSRGGNLADLILTVERHTYDSPSLEHSQIEHVFALGVSPNLIHKNKRPLGDGITHPVQFESFIKAGGDGALMSSYDEKPMPLWERLLLGSGAAKLHETVRAWANEQQGDHIRAKDIADYWERLRQAANHSPGANEVAGKMRGHEEFLTLRDDEGRNVCMYGIQMHASSWKTLEQKRFAALLPETDQQGRSLWYYAVLNGPRCGTDTVRFLLTQKVGLKPDQDGRGLLAQVVLSPQKEDLSKYDLLRLTDDTSKKVAKSLTAEQMFGVSDKEAKTFSNALINHLDTSVGFRTTVREFFKAHAAQLHQGPVLGAAALYLALKNDTDTGLALSCMQRGGYFHMDETVQGLVDKHITNKEILHEILQINQTHGNLQTLDAHTPVVDRARSSLRM